MDKLDIVIIVLVGLGGFSCFRAGFTRSVWGFVAISAGVFTASQLWGELAPILQRLIKHEGIAKWASVALIAAGVSVGIDFLFERFQRVIERGVLGWINNTIGAVFGVVASSILIGCILLLLNHYGGGTLQETIANARFAPTFVEIGHSVFDFGKEIIKEQVNKM
jgi:uncharacterized membrane protein required for colicin V production